MLFKRYMPFPSVKDITFKNYQKPFNLVCSCVGDCTCSPCNHLVPLCDTLEVLEYVDAASPARQLNYKVCSVFMRWVSGSTREKKRERLAVYSKFTMGSPRAIVTIR